MKIKIYVEGGSKYKLNMSNFFENNLISLPCGEIILNSIDDDGTGNGLDYNIIKKIPKNFNKPILLMGGAGMAEHISMTLKMNRVSGVVTANLFNFLGTGLEISRKKSIEQGINLAKFNTLAEIKK